MIDNEAKPKFQGLASAALILGTSLDLDLIAIELDTPVQMLKTWLTEINKMADTTVILDAAKELDKTCQVESPELLELKDLDYEISQELLDQDTGSFQNKSMGTSIQGLEKAVTDDLEDRVEIINGKITVIKAEDAIIESKRSLTAKEFRNGVIGLQLLNEELQGTAGTLIGKIAKFAELDDSKLTARDLASLTSALTNLQNAFFNKPVTNVNVGIVNGQGESLLSRFQERLRS